MNTVVDAKLAALTQPNNTLFANRALSMAVIPSVVDNSLIGIARAHVDETRGIAVLETVSRGINSLAVLARVDMNLDIMTHIVVDYTDGDPVTA